MVVTQSVVWSRKIWISGWRWQEESSTVVESRMHYEIDCAL